jgi:adenylate kinase
MKNNNIMVITGITGVGKDYLANRLAAICELHTINMGTLIAERLAADADRDLMMASFNSNQIREAQLAAYRDVVTRQPLLVTSHTVRQYGQDYQYDLELEQILRPAHYIFVHAPGDIVADRVRQRNQSGLRKSQELSPAEIERVQQTIYSAMLTLTDILGCKLTTLCNTADQLEQNMLTLQSHATML